MTFHHPISRQCSLCPLLSLLSPEGPLLDDWDTASAVILSPHLLFLQLWESLEAQRVGLGRIPWWSVSMCWWLGIDRAFVPAAQVRLAALPAAQFLMVSALNPSSPDLGPYTVPCPAPSGALGAGPCSPYCIAVPHWGLAPSHWSHPYTPDSSSPLPTASFCQACPLLRPSWLSNATRHPASLSHLLGHHTDGWPPPFSGVQASYQALSLHHPGLLPAPLVASAQCAPISSA